MLPNPTFALFPGAKERLEGVFFSFLSLLIPLRIPMSATVPRGITASTNQLLLTEGMFCSRCSRLPIPCPSVKLEIASPSQASICLTSYQEFLESVPPVTQAVEAFFLIWPQAVSGWESFPFLLCYLWWHITEDNQQRGEPEFRKEREPGEGVEALTSDPWEA